MNVALASYKFLFVPVSLGLLIPAAAIPWVSINFMGLHEFTPIQVVSELSNWGNDLGPDVGFDIRNLLVTYKGSYYSAVVSLYLYFISVAIMILSVSWRMHRSKVALVAGILSVTSAILWLYSVQSVKESFADQAALMGGIIGEEFKGHETTLADMLIRLGAGQYFVAASGALGILPYVSEKKALRKSQSAAA
jgi:hypothetical protein